MSKNLLYAPPFLAKKKARRARVFSVKHLPFPVKNILGSSDQLFLVGKHGRIFFHAKEERLDPQKLHPEYRHKASALGDRFAAIAKNTGHIGFFYQEGKSFYRLKEKRRAKDRLHLFQASPQSKLQLTKEGLLLYDPTKEEILYHKMFSESFQRQRNTQDVTAFYPGANGAIFIREGTSTSLLGHIDLDLRIREIPVAAKNDYLFASLENITYLLEGRTLFQINWTKQADWRKSEKEKLLLLEKRPASIHTQGKNLLLFYPGEKIITMKRGEITQEDPLPDAIERIAPLGENKIAGINKDQLLLWQLKS